MSMAIYNGHMKKKMVPAGQFKNSCLKLMDEVQKDGIPVVVTKRGKPVVEVVPAPRMERLRPLLGTVIYEAPDIFSTGEEWEAES
jgi:prevent-host-death family protein